MLRGYLPPQVAMTPGMMIPSPLASARPGRHCHRCHHCRPCVARGLGLRPPCHRCESRVRPGGWARGKGQKSKVPGRIRPRHCRPDARSHGLGPALVQGMACQPPASHGGDGRAVVASPLPPARRRQSAAAGPPLPACCCSLGQSILLGHGMAPRGARYANRLEGSVVRLAQKLVGVVHCGVWVVVVVTYVEACAFCDMHTCARICAHGHDHCVQS
jgi:hypothetical protein